MNERRSPPKVTVLLHHQEFARLDAYCHIRGFKKSTLIARLIRDYLDREGFDLQRELPLERPPQRGP